MATTQTGVVISYFRGLHADFHNEKYSISFVRIKNFLRLKLTVSVLFMYYSYVGMCWFAQQYMTRSPKVGKYQVNMNNKARFTHKVRYASVSLVFEGHSRKDLTRTLNKFE
jgi:hypothetical protein